jgi:hypothetical protein
VAFINKQGKNISYECSELIEELKNDIKEFGGATIIAVWCREYEGVIIYTNYDFISEDEPISESEIEDGEFIKQMTMTALLIFLEEQNRII